MTAEEFLKSIGITKSGEMSSTQSYVIDLTNEDEYAKIYSLLDKSAELEVIDDSSTITIYDSNIAFNSKDFIINLIADFTQDTYKLTCKKF